MKFWRLILLWTTAIAGTIAFVAFVTLQLQGPVAAEPANAAEWLSAISTFWGAVAAAIGAVMTGGALLVAAFTYRHQVEQKSREVEDKRRAQARTVRISVSRHATPGGKDQLACDLKNFGILPVSGLNVVAVDAEGQEVRRHLVELLLPEIAIRRTVPLSATASSYVSFRDTEGLSWKLYFDDRLEEQLTLQIER